MKLTAKDITKLRVYEQAVADAATLADSIAKVLAVGSPETLTDDQKAANEDRKATLADAVRQVANDAIAAGLAPERAASALRIQLIEQEYPTGTADGYGNAVKGFMALSDADRKVATVKDAQKAARTPKQVALDEARDALKPYIKAATVAQLGELLKAAQTIGIKLPEPKAGKVKDVTSEHEAAKVAVAA